MVAPIYSESIKFIKSKVYKVDSENNKFIFLTVGRLVPVKNVGLQIGAMAEAVKKYPNVELWIVGDGPGKSNLKSKISKLKLENNVKLLCWQNDTDKFYSQADVFLGIKLI